MNRTMNAALLAAASLAVAFLTACNNNSHPTPQAIAATSGSNQSALARGAFSAPLVATVTMGGSPVSGATVTFTAPSSGASGTFANSTVTDTETTDSNGVATSTAFTANGSTGSYTVTAAVSNATASFNLTNTTANFAFYVGGTETIHSGGDYYYALAGAVGLDALGNVLAGEQDYNDGAGLQSPASGDSITGGSLVIDPTTGQGTMTLVTNNSALGVSGTETFAVQFANAKHALISQFDTSAASTGSLDAQTLPSTLSGNYSFTLSGIDSSANSAVAAGVFSISGTNLQNGTVDVDDDGSVNIGNSFTGTVSAADSFGRGSIALSGGSTLGYYIVGPEVIRIVDVGSAESGVGSAYGQGSGTFSNASIGASVFALEANSFGFPYSAVAQFTVPSSGSFTGVGDEDEVGNVVSASPILGTYNIASNGYGSLLITNGGLQSVTTLGVYMTDPNLNLLDPNNTTTGLGGALIADLDTAVGVNGTGVLVPQTDTLTADFNGTYAYNNQDYFGYSGTEFDLVGQGSMSGGDFSGTGMVSDPLAFFSGSSVDDTGVAFTGTAQPDTTNVGRYTMTPWSVAFEGVSTAFNLAIYQASGSELFWIDEDNFSLSLGTFQSQGSLAGVPAFKRRMGSREHKH